MVCSIRSARACRPTTTPRGGSADCCGCCCGSGGGGAGGGSSGNASCCTSRRPAMTYIQVNLKYIEGACATGCRDPPQHCLRPFIALTGCCSAQPFMDRFTAYILLLQGRACNHKGGCERPKCQGALVRPHRSFHIENMTERLFGITDNRSKVCPRQAVPAAPSQLPPGMAASHIHLQGNNFASKQPNARG